MKSNDIHNYFSADEISTIKKFMDFVIADNKQANKGNFSEMSALTEADDAEIQKDVREWIQAKKARGHKYTKLDN